MCGIHLILDKKRKIEAETPSCITYMLDSAAYRGPDTSATKSFSMQEGKLHLGSNRLKIIDPHDHANQPFSSADGRYWLCFNGTIYNYFELRNKQLAQGIQFTTQSDTEVLLYLLISEGVAALEKLNGMFALFFYDSHEEKLLLARDRFGMKPMYYCDAPHYLVCSSETKSIIASGLVEKKLYEPAVHDYMRFRYVNPPYTFFENIYQLPIGCYMEIKGGEKSEARSYVRPISSQEAFTEAEVLDKTEDLLKDTVLNHLVGDVPSALLLSGGVDSTLMLSMVKELGAHPIPTFSVINSEKEAAYGTKDYYYARKAAKLYGSQHFELAMESTMLTQHFEEFLAHMDQPIGDSAAFMTYMISAEVKKRAGIALSGAGADELFGGYNRHQAYYQYLKNYNKLMKVNGILKTGSQWLPTGFDHPLRKKFRLLKKLGQSLDKDPALTFLHFSSQSFAIGDSSQLVSLKAAGAGFNSGFEENWMRAALEHELSHYLPADVLSLSDNMSMARSLEMRMPFLDLPLANYVRTLPASFRLKHGKKWIIKGLLNKRGGKEFSERSKEGFGLPFGQWLRKKETEEIRQRVQCKEQPIYEHISYAHMIDMLQAHVQKKRDYSQEIWSAWILASWLKYHF